MKYIKTFESKIEKGDYISYDIDVYDNDDNLIVKSNKPYSSVK